MKFETSYIETVLINMVKYENFDVHLVANIQAHLYNLRDLNFILNFKTANQLLLKLDNTGLGIYIGNYYDRINRENIDKTKLSIFQTIELLKTNIRLHNND